MSRYKAELKAIPPEYREPVRAFAEDGVIPTNQLVLSCCAGDFLGALKMAPDTDDLIDILTFLQNHVPPFAWGSAMDMARWEYMKKACAA